MTEHISELLNLERNFIEDVEMMNYYDGCYMIRIQFFEVARSGKRIIQDSFKKKTIYLMKTRTQLQRYFKGIIREDAVEELIEEYWKSKRIIEKGEENIDLEEIVETDYLVINNKMHF